MRYFLFNFLQQLTWILPLKVSYALADFGGWLQYVFSTKDRHAVMSNLKTLTGQKDVRLSALRVFQNFGRYLVDFCRMTRVVTPTYIDENIDVVGMEHIDAVLAQGKGGVILTAHMGNWEVGGAVLAQRGYPFHGIALPHNKSALNDWFNAQRAGCGIRSIPSHNAVRSCLEVLNKNALVGIVADRDFSRTGVTMSFLDRDFSVPKGAALFAYKTGAAVLPIFFYRQDNGRWCLQCFEPVYPENLIKDQLTDDDIKQFSRRYLPVFDKMIRSYPTQWLMFREYGKEV